MGTNEYVRPEPVRVAEVRHRVVEVAGVRVFCREAGRAEAPPLLLLHGFPSGSHQFRRLIDALGVRHHLIAPDYPGFGYTEAPDGFTYSFDALAEVVDGVVEQLGLRRFVLYMFDFGAPVGFRLAMRHPDRVAGLVVQNANAYEGGLSDAARGLIANRPGVDGAVERARGSLDLEVTRSQYETGASDLSLIAPDGWTLDQHFLDQPGRADAQVALTLDYHSNVELYPVWQQWLRDQQPPTLILWGRGDPFFTEAGARAYLADLPDAELHVFDTGHFALEEFLPEIAPLVDGFLDRTLGAGGSGRSDPPRIAVIGAGGQIGSAVAAEATGRGHRVTRLGHDAVDVTDATSVQGAVAGHQAVVVAVQGPDQLVSRAARALIAALPAAGVRRLVFVGGGASLEGAPGQRFLDSPDFPAEFRETAQDQAEALDVLRRAGAALDWSYASPPPVHLEPGDKTGAYRAEARDTPITDASGESRVSVGDYAAALLDAVDDGTFIRQRFTVAY